MDKAQFDNTLKKHGLSSDALRSLTTDEATEMVKAYWDAVPSLKDYVAATLVLREIVDLALAQPEVSIDRNGEKCRDLPLLALAAKSRDAIRALMPLATCDRGGDGLWYVWATSDVSVPQGGALGLGFTPSEAWIRAEESFPQLVQRFVLEQSDRRAGEEYFATHVDWDDDRSVVKCVFPDFVTKLPVEWTTVRRQHPTVIDFEEMYRPRTTYKA